MKPSIFALLVLIFLAGCAIAPDASPARAPAQSAKNERPPPDLQALLAACSPPGEKPWTRARCESESHDCWAQGGGPCTRDSVEVQGLRTETSSRGEVWVSGTLLCKGKGKGSQLQRLLVTSDSNSSPRRKLGGLELKWRPKKQGQTRGPGSVELWPHADPVPLVEDFRIPFRINLSSSGIPLERTDNGKQRASLFGLGSSEEGPSFMFLVKFEF